ncbi:hypothetical protein [Synechococcus sp. CS-1328]|uniref:hypothetical protein n=1 Tax=Synechococcus sp. CS-1328 TaxID=2847976 RepID=UPI00223BA713|nr:hypothetical protein [Synechococcus sp. CS-1328]MCT0224761.1 hypothetical protein [Synechococcus sp. CS-1328]
MLTSPDGDRPIRREWVHWAPTAVQIGGDDLPFVDIGGGNLLRMLQVFPCDNIWITDNVSQAGFESPMQIHTGSVWGNTFSESWMDLESEFMNWAGSFRFEPASSVHTLQILENDTRVRWHIHGSNLNLDAEGGIASIVFAKARLDTNWQLCEEQGHGRPPVMVL